ncbi:MAG: DUF1802 family protein [Candidatus Melainabacteria bacterium]|nr:DUF1802 family protein [Candidatus Melainabacteria bacterium]
MKFALKEWAVTTEALGQGQVVALWRKEPFESFIQKKLVLFPISSYQDQEIVKKEYLSLYEQSKGLNKDNQVQIKYWTVLEEIINIKTLDELLSISRELVNSEEYLKESWVSYPDHSRKLLLLRIYELEDPILILNSSDFAKSKPWIELKIDVPKSGSRPVLSFKEYSSKVRLIKALLEQAPKQEKVMVKL